MDPDPWADAAPSQGTSSQPEDASISSPSQSVATTAGSSSAGRASRLTPRRLVAQPTRLQVVEDDPLGPLGAGPASDGLPQQESPPAPPQKEQLPIRTTMPQPTAARPGGPADPHRIDDDEDTYAGASGSRQPPPVQAALPSPVRTSVQPSMSVERAAKPSFHITVGDPHKVGDLTSSHIVYSVRTKVMWRCVSRARLSISLTGVD